jgi:hypothetical protein
MLSQYLEGTPKIDADIRDKIQPHILTIILERVDKILHKVIKKELFI